MRSNLPGPHCSLLFIIVRCANYRTSFPHAHTTHSKLQKSSVKGGTVAWLAPERLNTKISKLGSAVDVWSFGVLLVELFAQTPIWDDMGEEMVKEELRKGHGPEELAELAAVDKNLHAIARACLNNNPAKRVAIAQVVEALQQIAPEGAKPGQLAGCKK